MPYLRLWWNLLALLIVLMATFNLDIVMIVQRHAPVPEIQALKAGDVYMGSEIKTLKKKGRIISFTTVAGDYYSAHLKNQYYNVFRNDRLKRKIERRKAEKAAWKAAAASQPPPPPQEQS